MDDDVGDVVVEGGGGGGGRLLFAAQQADRLGADARVSVTTSDDH